MLYKTRMAIRFRAKKKTSDSQTTPNFALVCLWCGRTGSGRAVYGNVITKFSGMGRFTYPWCSAGALRAPELRYKLLRLNVIRLNDAFTKTHSRGKWLILHLPPTFAIIIHILCPLRPCVWRLRVPVPHVPASHTWCPQVPRLASLSHKSLTHASRSLRPLVPVPLLDTARPGGVVGYQRGYQLLFCPKDTNIPQNRKICDSKYLKLFWNTILNTWKWTSQILVKEKLLVHCPLSLPLRSASVHGDRILVTSSINALH